VIGADKPVFSDDSGIRVAVLKWGVWAICFIAVLLGSALALTLRTHVSLPEVNQLQPTSREQIGKEAVPPAAETSSQPPQPSTTLQPSTTFQPTDAAPSPTGKRSRPTAGATAAARTRSPALAASTAQEATRVRNPKAASPTALGSRPTSKPASKPTSKPGNGSG
jgi:hypothetical protein